MDSSDGTLLETLTAIRVQINEAFDVLDDEELDDDTSAVVWSALDSAHDDISFAITELS